MFPDAFTNDMLLVLSTYTNAPFGKLVSDPPPIFSKVEFSELIGGK